MNCNYSFFQGLIALLVLLMITTNIRAVDVQSLCTAQAQILNQPETDSEEKKPEENGDDEEEDEEPECD